MKSVLLPLHWSETERANVFLVGEDATWYTALIRLEKPNTWLEIDIRPENHPSMHVGIIESTDELLLEHIRANCGWMVVRTLNLNLPDEVLEAAQVDGRIKSKDDSWDDEDDEQGGFWMTCSDCLYLDDEIEFLASDGNPAPAICPECGSTNCFQE